MIEEKLILLIGRPNCEKSKIFSTITEHKNKINLSEKKIYNTIGNLKCSNEYIVLNLPDIYSLSNITDEEILSRDAILFDNPFKIIIVVEPYFLEINLNLILQILEINDKILVILNMSDNINVNNIIFDVNYFFNKLNIPILIYNENNFEIKELLNEIEKDKESIFTLSYNSYLEDIINKFIPLIRLESIYNINKRYIALKLLEGDKTIVESINIRYGINIINKEVNDYLRNINFEEIHKIVSFKLNEESEKIAKSTVKYLNINNSKKIDKVITSKPIGIIFSILLIFLIFFITLISLKYTFNVFNIFFKSIESILYKIALFCNINKNIYELIILGMFRTISIVISTIFPSMIIFYSLFALLKESGFLPRLIFNFDKIFNFFKLNGKQLHCMCMGFGCNICGVLETKVFENKKNKIIAILTNNFIPCIGKIPLILCIISIFFIGKYNSIFIVLIFLSFLIISIFISLLISKLLVLIFFKGIKSHFILEIPSFKKPKILNVIWKEITEKVILIIKKILIIIIPSSIIIWLLANIKINNIGIINYASNFLNPFAKIIGLDGFILLAFILAISANEILLPLLLMFYLNSKEISEIINIIQIKTILLQNGWTFMTALSVCIFSILHFPCLTTLKTIKKEIGNKYAVLAFTIPTITGIILLFVMNTIYNIYV